MGTVARVAQAYAPCKAAEPTLDEVVGRFAAPAPGGFLADDENGVAFDHHPDGCRLDTWQVHRDLDRFIRFKDVNRRGAFAGERFTLERPAQFPEHTVDLVREISDVGRAEEWLK